MGKNTINGVTLDLNFEGVRKAIEAATDEALFAGGEVVLQTALPHVPRDTGDLADSGYVATEGKSTYQSKRNHVKERKIKGAAAVGFADFKAWWNEFGTVHSSAHPFMRPAIDASKGRVAAAIVSTIRKGTK